MTSFAPSQIFTTTFSTRTCTFVFDATPVADVKINSLPVREVEASDLPFPVLAGAVGCGSSFDFCFFKSASSSSSVLSPFFDFDNGIMYGSPLGDPLLLELPLIISLHKHFPGRPRGPRSPFEP